ncbi:MAG: 5-amino-6-(5-phosphoribosylamino)uracil reductase, partial [Actinobacteria bacterium HGW-Actinobacteria-11]
IIGAGERVFEGVPPQRLERVSVRATSLVTHITYRRI